MTIECWFRFQGSVGLHWLPLSGICQVEAPGMKCVVPPSNTLRSPAPWHPIAAGNCYKNWVSRLACVCFVRRASLWVRMWGVGFVRRWRERGECGAGRFVLRRRCLPFQSADRTARCALHGCQDFWGWDFGAQTYGPVEICSGGTVTFRWHQVHGVFQIPRPGVCPFRYNATAATLHGPVPDPGPGVQPAVEHASSALRRTAVNASGLHVAPTRHAPSAEEGMGGDVDDDSDDDGARDQGAANGTWPGAEGGEVGGEANDDGGDGQEARTGHAVPSPPSWVPGSSAPNPVPIPPPEENPSDFQELLPITQGSHVSVGMYVWALGTPGMYFATSQVPGECEAGEPITVVWRRWWWWWDKAGEGSKHEVSPPTTPLGLQCWAVRAREGEERGEERRSGRSAGSEPLHAHT